MHIWNPKLHQTQDWSESYMVNISYDMFIQFAAKLYILKYQNDLYD